jgi:hypothetical protein
MDRRLTAPYWRFWVTGAGYYALELDQPAEALKLLDQGLLAVRRDALMDILRSYRRIFVDSIPMRKLRYRKQVIEQQAQVLKALEERYLVGIESGVENSYVLATDLARLYQEQAGLGQDQVDAPSDATGNDGANRRDEYLRKALDYLDLAEKLYTGNPNHPIWDIYEQRIRILMAQHRYGDAFKFLRCLPASRLRDPSLTTMLNLASQMTGERIEDEATLTTERVLDNLDTVMSVLLRNEADLLFQIASQNPSVQAALLAVLQRLRRE